jgi:hypothetical protein
MALSLHAAVHAVFDNLKGREVQLANGIERQFLLDDINGHYQLLHIGWDNLKVVRNILVHIDIKSDLIWVQCDYTDYQIVDLLLEQGLTQQQIVLAFHAPYKRQYTGFAFGQ